MEEAEKIQLNREEVDQILGNPPSWILQWGMTLLALVVVIFIALAWVVKYPDVVSAKVALMTPNPVIPVIAPTSGKLDSLLVKNDQVVNQGEILALLDNPANFEDVLYLHTFLAQLNQQGELATATMDRALQLGTLQSNYAALIQKLRYYKYFLSQQELPQKIISLEKQINQIKLLNNHLKQQQITLTKEVQLALDNLERNQALYKNGVVSKVELEQIEAFYLQTKRQQATINSSSTNNEITLEQLKAEIVQLEQTWKNTQAEKTLSIATAAEVLKSEIELWKSTYLMTAPISGQVSFTGIWSEEQFVKVNTEVFSIVPNNENSSIVGRAALPIENSGKVKIGQKVNIQLDGFPYQEYGVIQGTIQHISLVPVNTPNSSATTYTLEIEVPSNLQTTYGKPLPFRQNMIGTANIITEDRRIIVRLLDKLNSILRNS